MLGDKTLLQHVMEEELKSFIKDHKTNYEQIKEPIDLSDSGSLLLELNSSSTAFQKLLDESYRTTISKLRTVSPLEYRNQLGERIIKIEEPKYIKDALALTHQTAQLVGDKFAGVIFVISKGVLVNPLHPLVALELLKQPDLLVHKILIYSYKNLPAIQQLYGNDDPSIFDKGIKSLMQVYQSQIKQRSIDTKENEYDTDSRTIVQKYRVSKYPGEDTSKEYYLVAHQLLTKGTYVPYYGTSLIQMNGNTSGYHITPFKSCNMTNHRSIEPTSVCTGSTSNKTITGLRTLHHANLGSPYQTDCMTNLSKPYADACIKQSFEIYQTAKFI